MGRPRKDTVLPSFGDDLKKYIINLRKRYPGWGAKTIHTELRLDPKFHMMPIPSVRSIGSLLKAHGLVRLHNKHVKMPESRLVYAQYPHQVWELDAQGGCSLNNIGPIAMINIKDAYSRIYCMAYPNRKRSIYGYSKCLDYQCALRLAFMEHGLPQIIQTDHEGVFYEGKCKSPFPTRFHLWLIGLGITQSFSRIHQPTDQARVERMHQTIYKQTLAGVEYQNWETLFNFCQNRRQFLNRHFPSTSLNHKAPYEAYPEAKHSGRYYHPKLEEQLFNLEMIYAFLSQGLWFRNIGKNKAISLGGNFYYLKNAQPKTQSQITFEQDSRQLVFHDEKGVLIDKLPIKGIDKPTLLGAKFWSFTNIQLELPITWEAKKVSTTFLHNT